MLYATKVSSPLGQITLTSDGTHLTGLWFSGQMPKETEQNVCSRRDLPVFLQTERWLARYFAKEEPLSGELPLAPAGSSFRQAVWKRLLAIPYGAVVTYGEIAKEMAAKAGKEKMSARAVGGAVGHNPISIIIPCHRVVGAHGNLTGYGGGLDKKIRLLTLEGVDLSHMHMPKKGGKGSMMF